MKQILRLFTMTCLMKKPALQLIVCLLSFFVVLSTYSQNSTINVVTQDYFGDEVSWI